MDNIFVEFITGTKRLVVNIKIVNVTHCRSGPSRFLLVYSRNRIVIQWKANKDSRAIHVLICSFGIPTIICAMESNFFRPSTPKEASPLVTCKEKFTEHWFPSCYCKTLNPIYCFLYSFCKERGIRKHKSHPKVSTLKTCFSRVKLVP